ncbi:predicted protein [Arabidopsis lyrata subsp. lyrata]|uniref:Predicted protein n=1 Tax=Arabidopsis lyrata subsp. lyrata TaxID=81972 RepID=D7M4M8_ARALL|nr:predicted protein [Arabidopsis lyrata subsp. lyrata]
MKSEDNSELASKETEDVQNDCMCSDSESKRKRGSGLRSNKAHLPFQEKVTTVVYIFKQKRQRPAKSRTVCEEDELSYGRSDYDQQLV